MSHLIIDVEGTNLTADDKLLLANPEIAGIILFARNYESKQQLQALTADIKSVNSDLIICVDQEGGRVQRFKQDFTELPALQTIDTEIDARHWAMTMATELINAGVDHSFAPVVDVDSDNSTIIGNRSFSDSADEVVKLAGAYIDGMNDAGMGATLKHFPGHGVVKEDSHLELPTSPLTLEALDDALKPFKALLNKADAIMAAHILFPAVDEKVVGYSEYWLKTILRGQLKFEGLIFSDDLTMKGAITGDNDNYAKGTELALNAGCDIVLICNQRSAAIEALVHLQQNPRPIEDSIKSQQRLQKLLRKTT